MSPIVTAAHALLRGELPGEPKVGGFCLQLVRIVVEAAFGWPSHELYRRHLTHKVERSPDSDTAPWARDMERSLTRQGLALDLPRTGPAGDPQRYVSIPGALPSLLPGDLLFRWDTAKNAHGDFIGHVALYLGDGLVLENVTNRAGSLQRGPTTLSRLGAWPVTSAARLPHERTKP